MEKKTTQRSTASKPNQANQAKTAPAKAKTNAAPPAVVDTASAALAAMVQAGDAQTRCSDGVALTYVSLAQNMTKARMKSETELYIKGLVEGEFFIQSLKINLGESFVCTPLMFLSVYNEVDSLDGNAKFVGVWKKEDAEKHELINYYDRLLPNGNYLRPVTWLFVKIEGQDELTNTVITFKSTAQAVAKELKKKIDSLGGVSSALRFTVTSTVEKNKSGQSYFQWHFEFLDRNFEITPAGVKFFTDDAKEILETAGALITANKQGLLVKARPSSAGAMVNTSDSDDSDDDSDDSDDDDEPDVF